MFDPINLPIQEVRTFLKWYNRGITVTSQVALMNRMAVALASDSMVTFGSYQTFPNVNKIYTLGGRHKIAVMVSGSATYIPGNIHWERVVAMWGENIGSDKTLDSLDEYVKEFIHFLQHVPNMVVDISKNPR